MNVKIIYENCGVKNYMKEDLGVFDATSAVAKRKPEKIQACTGFEHLTSAITVFQDSLIIHEPSDQWSIIAEPHSYGRSPIAKVMW